MNSQCIAQHPFAGQNRKHKLAANLSQICLVVLSLPLSLSLSSLFLLICLSLFTLFVCLSFYLSLFLYLCISVSHTTHNFWRFDSIFVYLNLRRVISVLTMDKLHSCNFKQLDFFNHRVLQKLNMLFMFFSNTKTTLVCVFRNYSFKKIMWIRLFQ